MSYSKTTLPSITPPEIAVQLDSGEYVALEVLTSRDPVNQKLNVRLKARQVDKDGQPVEDGDGVPVHAEYTNSFVLATCGMTAEECIKCCLSIMLEEPIVGIDAAVLAACGLPINITSDIRDAITAAKATAPSAANLL